MTRRNGLRLRTAPLERTAALDNWLLEHIAPNTLSLPNRGLGPQEALCMLFMSIKKGTVDGAFKNPDTYRLLLNVEANVNDYPTTSPLLCLGSFVGSNEDSDAPLWTHILRPWRTHYFLQPRTFAATLTCGMTNIKVESTYSGNISLRMSLWARQIESSDLALTSTSAPANMEEDNSITVSHRRRLIRRAPVRPKEITSPPIGVDPPRIPSSKLVRRVTTAPNPKVLEPDYPSPASLKRKRPEDVMAEIVELCGPKFSLFGLPPHKRTRLQQELEEIKAKLHQMLEKAIAEKADKENIKPPL
ncbi:hypothetical protein K438DRAFT_1973895 [Mycena galopus ATCC 62051]|nr:hypothetical protein K438DRAFT_1973895 [Mycena galopus ATCC 62051]